MHRYYIVPEIGDGSFVNEFQRSLPRAKYFGDMAEVSWVSIKLGDEPVRLVGADLSTFDHDFIAAQADVTVLPANLDANPGAGAVTTIRNQLEAWNIPAGWVTTALTYRQILRTVCAMFAFLQRLRGLGLGRLFTGEVGLNTQFQALPAIARTRLRDAADSLGFDRTGMTNAATVRQILKAMADQWSTPIYCGGGQI